MSNSIERFSDRVANYVKYRPDYPRAVISHLSSSCGMTPESIIADVGCGTGLSSKIFLENGNRVIGVEPNAAMRDAAVKFLADFPNFEIVDGTSSNTRLPDASIDFVVAAQAFHWFDPESTRPEFKRILRPGGFAVLMWNERKLDGDAFHIEYEEFLLKYGKDYQNVRHENIDEGRVRDFFSAEYSVVTFPNQQVLDFDGLKGRMLSSSYMPNENDGVFVPMVEELQSVFAKHAENGRIRVLYDTNVYISRL